MWRTCVHQVSNQTSWHLQDLWLILRSSPSHNPSKCSGIYIASSLLPFNDILMCISLLRNAPTTRAFAILAVIVTCGILRTTPTDLPVTINGFIFPEMELRLIGLSRFWVRSFIYDIDVSKGFEEGVVTSFCSPRDISISELCAPSDYLSHSRYRGEKTPSRKSTVLSLLKADDSPPADCIITER